MSTPSTATGIDGTQLIAAVNTLFTAGVMSHSGHGDASARLDSRRMLITRPGFIRDLTQADLAFAELDGSVRAGEIDDVKLEIVALHAEIYRRRGDVNSILHTHSPALLAFAIANKPLSCCYEAMRFGQPAEVPVVPWSRRGTSEWSSNILQVLDGHPSTRSILLGNHGVLVFGPDCASTASLTIVLEEAAEGELGSDHLGGALPLPLGGSSDRN